MRYRETLKLSARLWDPVVHGERVASRQVSLAQPPARQAVMWFDVLNLGFFEKKMVVRLQFLAATGDHQQARSEGRE